jgi:hypothetical protein
LSLAAFASEDLGVQDAGKPRIDMLIADIRQGGTIRHAFDGRRVVTNR